MAVSDAFPVDPDYTVGRTRRPAVATFEAASGEKYLRVQTAPVRIFSLQFQRRAVADWLAIENFRLAMLEDVFDFHDKTLDRHYAVRFTGEPTYQEIFNQMVNIQVELEEAVGVAPSVAPTGPLVAQSVAGGVETVNGMGAPQGTQFTYFGYGYHIETSFLTGLVIDGVVVSPSAIAEDFSLPLGRHTIEIQPAAAIMDVFQAVI